MTGAIEATNSGAPTTSAPDSTSAAGGPPVDAQLAAHIPTVTGYTIGDVPPDDPSWRVYDFGDDLRLHEGLIVGPDGVAVGRLIVAASTGDRPAIDTFVEHTFAEGVNLPVPGGASSTEDGGGAIATAGAVPVWTDIDGNAVVRAEQEDDHNVQWGWSSDELVWIVRGTAATEDYVHALVDVQDPALDPFDQQGMTGDLYDHTPHVPGYTYWDFPRINTVAEINLTPLGDCVERFYRGYILPNDVPDDGYDPDDLGVGIAKAAGACIDNGILDDLAANLTSSPGASVEEIGGVTVWRDEQSIVALVGDVLIILTSANPQTLTDMNGFIESFLASQPG